MWLFKRRQQHASRKKWERSYYYGRRISLKWQKGSDLLGEDGSGLVPSRYILKVRTYLTFNQRFLLVGRRSVVTDTELLLLLFYILQSFDMRLLSCGAGKKTFQSRMYSIAQLVFLPP